VNLADRLDRSDRLALVDDHRTLSYAAFTAAIEQAAAWLTDRGIRRGDRVAVLSTNRSEVFVALFACARIGTVLVPLNTRLADAELAWMVQDCGVSLALGDCSLAGRIADVVTTVAFEDVDWWTSQSAVPPSIGLPDDDILIVYTSGTTGRPKGAVLKQSALIANAENGCVAFEITRDHLTLGVLPLFHVGGLNITATPTLLAGGSVRLHAAFDPGRWLADVAAFRPTTSILVPAMIVAVTSHPAWATTDLSSLTYLVTGSSEIPLELLRRFLDRNVPIGQVYGLTETSPIAIVQRREDVFTHVGSTGHAAVLTRFRIVDGEGGDVPLGGEGEIVVAGPNVFDRYWDNPSGTADAFTGEWFRTGDMGVAAADGQVRVCGRIKEMVISGGENIYPAELEAVLLDDPRIAEAAVVGRPDDRWGEVPVAVVVVAAGAALTEDDTLALFTDRLARFKHPKAVVFVDQLPRTAMGKIRKHDVRASLARPQS
jgi:fatty-acyl-CoA synthase